MVLPVRIELTTSALPRMRSTTELRQHFVRERRAYEGRPCARQPGLRQACGCPARKPCGSYDWQRQGARGAARSRASREPAETESAIAETGRRREEKDDRSLVPVPQLLLAERAVDAACDRVADPDDGAEHQNGEN